MDLKAADIGGDVADLLGGQTLGIRVHDFIGARV